jgi:hypothetical protein
MFYGYLRPSPDFTRQIRETANRAKENALDLEELHVRLERLQLVSQALWNLLKQKTGMTDAELQKEIDGLEQAEAKPATAALVCKDCGKPVSRQHKVCIYCGGPDLVKPPGAKPLE